MKSSKLIICSDTDNDIDNNDQFNAEVYKRWLLKLLDHIEEPFVIVIGNVSYNLNSSENYPG